MHRQVHINSVKVFPSTLSRTLSVTELRHLVTIMRCMHTVTSLIVGNLRGHIRMARALPGLHTTLMPQQRIERTLQAAIPKTMRMMRSTQCTLTSLRFRWEFRLPTRSPCMHASAQHRRRGPTLNRCDIASSCSHNTLLRQVAFSCGAFSKIALPHWYMCYCVLST